MNCFVFYLFCFLAVLTTEDSKSARKALDSLSNHGGKDCTQYSSDQGRAQEEDEELVAVEDDDAIQTGYVMP